MNRPHLLLPVLLSAFLLTACAAHDHTAAGGSGITLSQGGRTLPSVTPRPDLPLDAVRAEVAAARAADPQLEPAFFTSPLAPTTPALDTERAMLLDRIRAEVAPDTWTRPGRTLRMEGAYVFMIQRPEVIRAAQETIARISREQMASARFVRTDVRILSVAESEAAAVLARALGDEAARSVLADGGDAASVVLDDDAVARLQGAEGVETLSAPSLMTWSGQRGNITIANQTSYVSDWDVYWMDGARIADPVIDVVNDGVIVDVRGAVDGDRVDVDLEVTVAELLGLKDGEVDGVGEIQTPEVRTTGATGSWSQTGASTRLLATPAAGERRLLVVVTAAPADVPEGDGR